MMQVKRYDNAKTFYTEAKPFLQKHEAENNLLFGILDTLINSPEYYRDPPYFALVTSEGEVLEAALRTPPHTLVLARSTDLRAVEVLAKALREETLPGVSGPKTEAEAFVRAWQALTGQTCFLKMPQRIYKLEQVTPVENVPGTLRQAGAADRSLLVSWTRAFNLEAVSSGVTQDAVHIVNDYLHSPNRALYLWEVAGESVAMAGTSGPTPTGIRIGAVYTPPEQRRRGFASACVAALSEQLLKTYKFCCLYTDLTNPTSNHIYQTIGYQAVCDVNAYEFS